MRIKNRSLQPSTSMQKLTTRLMVNSCMLVNGSLARNEPSSSSSSCLKFTAGAAVLGWPHHKDGRRTHAQSNLLQQAPRRKARTWCSKKALQRSAEQTVCTVWNQPSVMAAGSLRPRQLALISEKSQLLLRHREAQSRKGKTQEAEGVSSIPTILTPNLRLSKVR